MPRRPLIRRSGVVSRGLIFMLAGFSDIVMAMLFWYFIGRGDTMFTFIFALLGLSGLGIMAFGTMLVLRDS
ncbi:MAG: hypothetical protein WDZ51_17015 [Pirellulaceae bacterium]